MRSPGSACLLAGAAAGVLGPVAFTAAWVAASLRQTGYPASQIQISGLAAPGARDPWLMMAGFLVLGGCLIAFAPALRAGLGGSHRAGPVPWLITAAGVLTIAAGLLRRDHMLLTPGPQSWHNLAHNVVSGVIYVLLIAVPLLLAARLRGGRRGPGPAGALTACALATGALLAVFASGAARPWDGTLQRVAVSIPLAALIAVAVAVASRLLAGDRDSAPPLAHPAGSARTLIRSPRRAGRRPDGRCAG
jgi:Protein of unknown function (DUF998)